MKLYENLDKINFLKTSFLFKLWFVCVLGFVLEFFISVIIFFFSSNDSTDISKFLLFFFSSVVVVTGVLFSLKKMINPIILASNQMNNYILGKSVIQLPVLYNDEIGLLLKNINHAIKNNTKVVDDKINIISLLAHDLRQYAGNPISLCQILKQDKTLSHRSIEIVNFIVANASKQVDFIDSFIELLRFENEIFDATKKVVSIHFDELKASLLKDFELKLKSKNIKLIFKTSLQELVIEFESVLFNQILSNLIDNSIKFSTDGSTVIVDIKIVDGKYSISVIDNGIGFNPSISSELFNKFTIYGRLGTHNEKSNGIGLYLCRTIAEKFNAKIVGISAGDHKGSKFILLIDVYKQQKVNEIN